MQKLTNSKLPNSRRTNIALTPELKRNSQFQTSTVCRPGPTHSRISLFSDNNHGLDCTIASSEYNAEEIELEVEYNNYLDALLQEAVMKKKLNDLVNLATPKLATIALEHDKVDSKISKLRERELDIKCLYALQNELDIEVAKMNKYKDKELDTKVNNILSHLLSILEKFDELHCTNIILPKHSEEWKILYESIEKCNIFLEKILCYFGSTVPSYQNTHEKLREFITVYNNAELRSKKFKEMLCNLQVLTLKNAALTLTL